MDLYFFTEGLMMIPRESKHVVQGIIIRPSLKNEDPLWIHYGSLFFREGLMMIPIESKHVAQGQ